MDLDELKHAWRTLDERVNYSIDLNLRVRTELRLDKARASLRRLAREPWIELVMNGAGAVLVGSFLGRHLRDLKFAAPGVVLLAVFVLLLVSSAKQLAVLGGIDYSAPVVTIQRTLADLYATRLRVTRWVLITAPLLWTPLVIVSARGLFGLDVYRAFGIRWIAANVVFGLAVIVLAIWIARRFADRFGRSSTLRRLADDVAGRNLTDAMGFLREIAQFKSE